LSSSQSCSGAGRFAVAPRTEEPRSFVVDHLGSHLQERVVAERPGTASRIVSTAVARIGGIARRRYPCSTVARCNHAAGA